MNDKVAKLLRMWADLKGRRVNWETHWRQVSQYVIPNKVNVFDFMTKAKGDEKHQRLYDGTPEHFNELLASALHSMLTNPTQQWFDLSSGDEDLDKNPEVKAWMQKLVRKMHQLLNNSNFNTEIHELFLDLGSFGTGVLRVVEDKDFIFRFNSRPIAEHHIKENSLGEVDTVFTPVKMTVRQISQKFGSAWLADEKISSQNLLKTPEKEFTVIHAVFPREDAKELSAEGKTKAFASFHFIDNPAIILKESGFNELPYIVSRWLKVSGEVYGRSPSMKALPDIRMLNATMRDTIRSAQKVTDPPLMVPDDGMLNPTDTRPGGINYYRAGTPDRIFPLETRGQPRIGFDVINDIRSRISKHYFIDQLQLRESDRMTATEVLQRTDEQLRLLGPILGRQHFELLQPLVARMLSIMVKKKEMPLDMPDELKNISPQVKFVSQIAKAQQVAEGQNINRVIEQVGFLIQSDPSNMDILDSEEIIRFSANIHGLPEELVRRPEEIQELRQQRAQEQQALLQSQLAAEEAKTNETNAKAQQTAQAT